MPPLPPPLPPETRTVGQLVAESLRLYGRKPLAALALGLPVALVDQVGIGLTVEGRALVFVAAAPLFSLAYAYAVALAADVRPSPSRWLVAVALGTVVFAPAGYLFPWFSIGSVLWLGFVGLVVPVVLLEGLGGRAALRRAARLGRADYVHAAGSLATLTILFGLTRILLALLLRSQADNTLRVAVFLADLVVSPLIFLGAALLYWDQEARSRIGRKRPRRAER